MTFFNHAVDEKNEVLIQNFIKRMPWLYHFMLDDCKNLLKTKQISFIELVTRLENIESLPNILDYSRTTAMFLQLPLIEAGINLNLEFLSSHWNEPNRNMAREIMISIFQAQGPLSQKIEVLLTYQGMGGADSQASLNYIDNMGNNYLHWFFNEDAAPWHIRPELMFKLIPDSDGHAGYSAKSVFTHKNEDGVSPMDILLESNNPYADEIIKTIMGYDFHLSKENETSLVTPGTKFY